MRLRYIALVPMVALAVAILAMLFFGFSENSYFNPPNFVFATNLIFWSIASVSIAYISAKSFLKEGSAVVLIISCSIIFLGLSLIISGYVTNFSGNYSVAIANIGILVASALQVLCGILTFTDKTISKLGNSIKTLISIYIATFVFVFAVSALVLLGYVPTFYTALGPTVLRQTVLGLGIILFAIACILFIGQYLKSKVTSLYWYALAIGLISISLSSTFEVKVLGDLPTWLGRIGLYIGTIYLITAILSTKKKDESIDRASAWAGAFKANPEQFEALFSNMLDAFIYGKIIIDKAGKPVDWVFLDINPSYGRIAGLARDQILGKTASELYPEEQDDPTDWIGKYGHVALTCEPMHFEGYRLSLKKWLHVSSYSPKKGYFIAIFEDVTERKKAEEALKESEQLYHSVFDNSQDGFQLIELVYDKNGKPIDHRFLKVNHAYEKIIGVKAEDILDKTAKYISPNQEFHWLEIPERVAKTGISEHVELYNKDINKTLDCFYFLYSKNVIGTLFRDITEQKNLEKQLQDSERLAAIGATAGMVGHDIRNPLQSITGDVYLAKTELASTPESEEKNNIRESLIEIEKNIDYINKIVQDLQDYARPLNPNAGEVNLKLIIEKLLVKNNLPKNIEVSIKIEDDFEKFVVDTDYLNRILFNLVTNAVQAMPKGGRLTIKTYKEENDVVISVKDTGVGIPKGIQSKMFTPMFTTKSKGQGFGLPVVKRMTESLGGTVSFESEEGKGTTFFVRLPLKINKT